MDIETVKALVDIWSAQTAADSALAAANITGLLAIIGVIIGGVIGVFTNWMSFKWQKQKELEINRNIVVNYLRTSICLFNISRNKGDLLFADRLSINDSIWNVLANSNLTEDEVNTISEWLMIILIIKTNSEDAKQYYMSDKPYNPQESLNTGVEFNLHARDYKPKIEKIIDKYKLTHNKSWLSRVYTIFK